MKRILWLGSFTLSFLLLQSIHARAGGYVIPADCAHGFTWLKAKALNKFPWIHQHGPLYNYGPYYPNGVGYNYLRIPPHRLGYYVPAYPYAYYQGGHGQPAPAVPPMAPAIQAPANTEHPIGFAPIVSEISTVSYETFYPIYLQNPWPSQR